MKTKTTLMMMLLTALAMFGAQAETVWYMDYDRAPKDPDERDGSWEYPFKDFADAITAAEKLGQHVTVKVESSQPYELVEMLKMPPKGITFMPLETDGLVTLDGNHKYTCVYDEHGKSTFYRFRFINGFENGDNGGGVAGATLVDSVISNCWSGANGGGAWKSNLTNCLITCCSAGGNGGGADHCGLYGCLVISNCAAQVGGGVSHSDLWNCTIARNMSWAKDSRWKNRYFGSACHGSTEVSEDGKVTNKYSAVNCIVVDNESLASVSEIYGYAYDARNFGNLDGDPRFEDAEDGDYRLRSDSPCIDIGNTGMVGEPAVDFDGNPRVRGAGIDCGCYEFQRHAAFPPGTLNVSSNAQVIGTVMYAQGGWSVTVDDSAKDWLSADVTAGVTTNTLRLTFKENATGFDRTGTISVFTNGSSTSVQTIRIGQVANAAITGIGNRKGLFIGCATFAKNEQGRFWVGEISGCENDARGYRDIWCGSNVEQPGVSVVLTNAQATLEAVTNHANAIIANLDSQDEFLLSLSTHGGAAYGYWESAFCLYPVNEVVSFSVLSNILIRASQKCRKVFCFLDTCHSAGAYKFADQMSIDGEITDRHAMPRIRLAAASPSAPYAATANIAIIAAADYDQYSQSGKVNGRFTSRILEGVREGLADADGDGYLDLHELWRYAYYTAKYGYENTLDDDMRLGQARCYNAPLLLKTRLCALPKAVKPSVDNPLNPYHVEFVNWLRKCAWKEEPDFEWPENVSAASLNRVSLTTGGSMSFPDAFVAGYEPIVDAKVDPLVMSISVTNSTPYLSWEPCKRDLFRVYSIRAKESLTNDWTNLGENVPPETLKAYHFFSVSAGLRQ